MSQWAKAYALSLIPGAHMMERTGSCMLSFDLHKYLVAYFAAPHQQKFKKLIKNSHLQRY